VLVSLANLVEAPIATWSSDRGILPLEASVAEPPPGS
jgi:hypothetical protein